MSEARKPRKVTMKSPKDLSVTFQVSGPSLKKTEEDEVDVKLAPRFHTPAKRITTYSSKQAVRVYKKDKFEVAKGTALASPSSLSRPPKKPKGHVSAAESVSRILAEGDVPPVERIRSADDSPMRLPATFHSETPPSDTLVVEAPAAEVLEAEQIPGSTVDVATSRPVPPSSLSNLTLRSKRARMYVLPGQWKAE